MDSPNDEQKHPYHGVSSYARSTDPAPTAISVASKSYEALKERLHNRVVEIVKPADINRMPEAQRQREIGRVIEQLIDTEEHLLNAGQHGLVQDLLDEMIGLGPLEKLLHNPRINDILVNGPHQVYVERHGVLEEDTIQFRDNAPSAGNHLAHRVAVGDASMKPRRWWTRACRTARGSTPSFRHSLCGPDDEHPPLRCAAAAGAADLLRLKALRRKWPGAWKRWSRPG